MAMSSAMTSAHPGAHPARPNRVAVGTIIWLSSELMFFAGLFSMYFTLRATNLDVWANETQLLNVPFATVNTLILVSSSVTCQLGVLAAERGDMRRMQRFYLITLAMGTVFVAGQLYEYVSLVREGLTLSSSPYGSAFFLTTGFHGLHVVGGLVAFVFVLARSLAAKRYGPHQATAAIVTSYYWHFVDVVWIALFFTIYVLQ